MTLIMGCMPAYLEQVQISEHFKWGKTVKH